MVVTSLKWQALVVTVLLLLDELVYKIEASHLLGLEKVLLSIIVIILLLPQVGKI